MNSTPERITCHRDGTISYFLPFNGWHRRARSMLRAQVERIPEPRRTAVKLHLAQSGNLLPLFKRLSDGRYQLQPDKEVRP
jgi:hypothetical protein